MSTKTKKENKYILNDDQIMVLKFMHIRIISEGLEKMDLTKKEIDSFLISATETFDILIKDAQGVLTEIGGIEEIRKQLKGKK